MVFHLIKDFKRNIFIPTKDSIENLPNDYGAYLICGRSIDCLPLQMKSLNYKFLDDRPVLYVGISTNLRKRNDRNHFNGTARDSTLRKSLGVLLGYDRIQLQSDKGTSKYRFKFSDEEKLTNWMNENLILYFITLVNSLQIKKEIVDFFHPPLNIRDNYIEQNHTFRLMLKNKRMFK